MVERIPSPSEQPPPPKLPRNVLPHMLDDIHTQVAVACAFLRGRHGVDRSPHEALFWFERAAERGNASALYNLGVMYYKGDGVVRDLRKAVEYYRRAAEKGNTSALYNLGLMYEYGEGVGQDDQEANTLQELATAQGHASSMFNLARKFMQGNTVQQDTDRGMALLTASAEKGYPPAQGLLAAEAAQGGDMDNALHWFTQAANRGHTLSQRSLGQIYASGYGGTARDLTLAYVYLSLAAREGDAESRKWLSAVRNRLQPEQLQEADQRLAAMGNIRSWEEEDEEEVTVLRAERN